MMTAEQQADLERFAHFLAEMIAKYGMDVLAEIDNEKEDADNTGTTTAA